MAKDENEKVRVECSTCGGGYRNHSVVARFEWTWDDEVGDPSEGWVYQLHGCSVYQICQCQGCDTVRFRKTAWSSEEPGSTEEVFPQTPKLRHKAGVEQLSLLPKKVRRVYDETLIAMNAGAAVLAGGGLRAVVEALCKDKGVTGYNLEAKIDELVKQRLLAEPQAKFLHEARFIGNTALHEIEPPSEQELALGLQVIEGLLQAIYVLPEAAGELERLRTAKKASQAAPLKKKLTVPPPAGVRKRPGK